MLRAASGRKAQGTAGPGGFEKLTSTQRVAHGFLLSLKNLSSYYLHRRRGVKRLLSGVSRHSDYVTPDDGRVSVHSGIGHGTSRGRARVA